MKNWWYKCSNWEFWPNYIIYLPEFLYWVYLAFSFKSIRFYRWVNPGIKNGGLFGDSKKAIYNLLPPNLYPRNCLILKNSGDIQEFFLSKQDLQFPLIVKPDVGLRGKNVCLVHSIEEINAYKNRLNADFLIQEFIPYENEIGLFYVKMPFHENGKIIGLTLKNFLTIVGDGKKSMRELLEENPRFALQINKLNKEVDLNEIVPNGVKKCLVPFGNHNRGTKFLDGHYLISNTLEDRFNLILKDISGFYYGRLDIRFKNFEELEKGLNFKIIEINGAKSEPTHIYDPKYSFWEAQNEIFKLMRYFVAIIKHRNYMEN